MIRLRNLCVAALLVVFLSAATASAQQMSGTVKDVYPAQRQLVIADPRGTPYVFGMDEDAQVYVDDMPAVLEDLQKGDRVAVIYRVEEDQLLAIEVRCRR
jgi:hypothetical protein